MKVIVFTDTHANLPALLAFRRAIEQEGYDLAVHTGDAIDIGPYPAESLDVLLNLPRTEFIMGNHDAIFVRGMANPLPCFMEASEAEHCCWTATQLSEAHRDAMKQWPYYTKHEFDGTTVSFVHYGLNETMDDFIALIKKDPTADDLDVVFAPFDTDLLFYGHHHPFCDVQGRLRYINPGALGCFYRPLARYCVLEITDGALRVTYKTVPYDDSDLLQEYERRQVPARRFILKEFFGKNID